MNINHWLIKLSTLLISLFFLTTCSLFRNMEILEEPMIEHKFARYSIQLPKSIKKTYQENGIDAVYFTEFLWKTKEDKHAARHHIWSEMLKNAKETTPDEGMETAFIEYRDLSNDNYWHKTVAYYNNSISTINWESLVDKEIVGIELETQDDTHKKEEMLRKIIRVVDAYRNYNNHNVLEKQHDHYYTQYGVVELPHQQDESIRLEFKEKTLKLVLTIAIGESSGYRYPFKSRAKLISFSSVFKIIKNGERMISGLLGEEVIFHGSKNINFTWDYPGNESIWDGRRIKLMMEANKEFEHEAKIVWNKILQTFKPLNKSIN